MKKNNEQLEYEITATNHICNDECENLLLSNKAIKYLKNCKKVISSSVKNITKFTCFVVYKRDKWLYIEYIVNHNCYDAKVFHPDNFNELFNDCIDFKEYRINDYC